MTGSNEESFFSDLDDFQGLGVQSAVLLDRINNLHLSRPTAVQAAAFRDIASGNKDVTVGAETGSGKTYAYLIPLMDDILQRKKAGQNGLPDYDYARAIILVPNKELVQQVVRMALPLAGGKKALVYGGSTIDPSILEVSDDDTPDDEVVRLAIIPGGLNDPMDFPPFRKSVGLGGDNPPVDLLVTTPASLGSFGLKPKLIDMFADIQTLVIDEADMLLDGGYIRPLENVLLGFRRADRIEALDTKTQHIFVAATLPDYGLRSVDSYLQKKFPYAERITLAGMHNARHFGLAEQTVWIEEDSKKKRMEGLVALLNQSPENGGLQGKKVMVFLNSVDDVEGACSALLRAGVVALPYHAKISLSDRTSTLERFRRFDPLAAEQDEDAVSILVCSDLAARGLDVPNVNVVVQLQFAGNVVAHLHRMGRSGRAGQRSGRGIIYYGEKERDLVEVVRQAEEQQERMVLEGDVLDLDEEEAGTVKKAFSRKRGFTKKRKKDRRDAGP